MYIKIRFAYKNHFVYVIIIVLRLFNETGFSDYSHYGQKSGSDKLYQRASFKLIFH